MSIALAIWTIALCLTLFSTWLTLRHFETSPPNMDAPFTLFPVTILKPLKGRDSGLKENLRSFFLLDYPEYELLFSVADENDPATAVIRELMNEHVLGHLGGKPARGRKVQARLMIGAANIGDNPKVNNMIRSYEMARYDWILISDSNVRVKPDYLKRMVGHVENGVGMVTSVVAGCSPEGQGAMLESIYLNTFYARGMVLTAKLGHPCVVGKSMLFQKSVAERFGGLRTLACYLAEDYMAGEAMKRLGLRTVIASDPIDQHIGGYSLREFWMRHLRWGRIRKAQALFAFLIEPWMGCMLSGALGAWAAPRFFGIHSSTFFLLHLLVWSGCDLLVMKKMKARISVFMPAAWFLREALAFPLWLHIASGNRVNWRGTRYTIRQGGLLAKTYG